LALQITGPTLFLNLAGDGDGFVDAQPPGVVCKEDCPQIYPSGTVVTLTAYAETLLDNFAGWQGACNGAGITCTLTMDADTVVTAAFEAETIDFVGVPRNGEPPLTMQFTTTSTGTMNTIIAYRWKFGDGGLADTLNPTHTYKSAGNFGVTLAIIGEKGTIEESKPDYITVKLPPGVPTATFRSDITSGPAPLTVTFTAVPSGTVEQWLWDFGDGNTASTGPEVSHTYFSKGTVDVSLVVSNNKGSSYVNRPNYITVTMTNQPTIYLPLVMRNFHP